jgi:hypothetical protein
MAAAAAMVDAQPSVGTCALDCDVNVITSLSITESQSRGLPTGIDCHSVVLETVSARAWRHLAPGK